MCVLMAFFAAIRAVATLPVLSPTACKQAVPHCNACHVRREAIATATCSEHANPTHRPPMHSLAQLLIAHAMLGTPRDRAQTRAGSAVSCLTTPSGCLLSTTVLLTAMTLSNVSSMTPTSCNHTHGRALWSTASARKGTTDLTMTTRASRVPRTISAPQQYWLAQCRHRHPTKPSHTCSLAVQMHIRTERASLNTTCARAR